MFSKRSTVLSIVMIIFILASAEIFLRMFKPHVFFSSLLQSNDNYNHTYVPNCKGKYVVGNREYVFYLHFNSLGLCQEEDVVIPKPQDVYRVLIIGDSFVAGLKRSATIPFALNSTLNNMRTVLAKRIEFVNCGQSSYSPLLYLARLKHQYKEFEPDAIILMPDLTDVFDDNFRYKKLVKTDKNGDLLEVSASPALLKYEEALAKAGFYATNSYLIRAFIKKYMVKLQKSDENNYDKSTSLTADEIKYTISNIKKIIEFAKSQGIYIAIATYPHLWQITSEDGVDSAFEREIEMLCKAESVSFKSFHGEIAKEISSGKQLYFESDMHFNENGIKILSGYMAKWILQEPEKTIGTEIMQI